MSGEMPEEIAAQIAGDADEGIAGDPAGERATSRLSAAISDTSSAKASQMALSAALPDSTSTRNFTPYCELTEQATAPITAARMAACEIARRRT